MAPHAKPQNSVRRVSSLSKVSTPPSSARASKSSKAAKLPPPPPSSSTKKPAAPAVTTATTKEETRPAEPKLEVVSPPPPTTTSSDTPQPSIHESALKPATKQSNPKTGTKRGLGAGVSDPKPRARPGPKKKLKLEDANGENGGSNNKTGPGGVSVPAHKLGPKANQGAINAGLRALDRTGKPCRRWEKKGFFIKTFTGVTWELPSWRTAQRHAESGNISEKGSLPTSNSQSKDNNSSSHVGSENSSIPPDGLLRMDTASSPAPGITISA